MVTIVEVDNNQNIIPATHDQVRENATLCMQHLAIVRLFHQGIRMGDTGVLEGMLDILTLFFHGTNNSRYAGEFLLQNINRRALWTPFYPQIWLDNCLVNISGRPNCWLSLDEVCEITVDQLKNDYNLRGSWQSRDYHLNTVSPNIHLLRIIKEQVMRSCWASTGGLRKGAVSIMKDITVLCISVSFWKTSILFLLPSLPPFKLRKLNEVWVSSVLPFVQIRYIHNRISLTHTQPASYNI